MAGPWEKYQSGPWDKYSAPAEEAAKPPREELFAEKLGRGVANLAAGAVRGAGSIGATLLAPVDIAADALAGRGLSLESNRQRRQAMDDALQSLGADPSSLAYGGGKVVSEIAGTLGLGGVAANAVSRVPGAAAAAPRFIEALRTGGMTTGAAPVGFGAKAADMGIRMAGGAAQGGLSAAAVNPEDTAGGVAVGALAPPVLQAAGKAGQAIGRGARALVASPTVRSGNDLARALDLATPADVRAAAQALRAAQELVPGSRPTVAQALQTPQAGILQRVVGDTAGGGALRDALVAQNTARLDALERVAPTVPGGFASARQDLGESVARFATGARDAAKARTAAAYQAVPQDEAALYLPDLAQVRDKYFGPGVFTGRAEVDRAVQTAQQLGTMELPALTAARGGAQPMTLAQAVRRAGGLSLNNADGLRGEVSGLRGGLKNLVRQNGGLAPGHMAEKMREAGYLQTEDAQELFDALRSEAMGRRSSSIYDAGGSSWQAARDAAMGDAPGAESVARKVTLKDFDDLRKSIGQVQRAAAQDPARATEAKALADMKAALDNRINEVVRGDGAADEVLPLAWADALDQARKLKVAEVERFMTGPQARMFRRGADGLPQVQGGEVSSLFWGNRPGLSEDVQAFRRLVDDNPRLLGQFRSMVTTEGAGMADAGGRLTTKFARWVDNMMPGIEKAFEPDQVDLLRRLSQDVRRAESAAAAGMSRGSNTYQNAQNALSLGLLDSPAVSAIAGRVPLAGPAVNWLRDASRAQKATRLAEVLADANAAANALDAAGNRVPPAAIRALSDPAIQALFYRAAPGLVVGQ